MAPSRNLPVYRPEINYFSLLKTALSSIIKRFLFLRILFLILVYDEHGYTRLVKVLAAYITLGLLSAILITLCGGGTVSLDMKIAVEGQTGCSVVSMAWLYEGEKKHFWSRR